MPRNDELVEKSYQTVRQVMQHFQDTFAKLQDDLSSFLEHDTSNLYSLEFFKFGTVERIFQIIDEIQASLQKDFLAFEIIARQSLNEKRREKFIVRQSFLLNNLNTTESLMNDLFCVRDLEGGE